MKSIRMNCRALSTRLAAVRILALRELPNRVSRAVLCRRWRRLFLQFFRSQLVVQHRGSHNGNKSILYTYGDTISWNLGKHALKFAESIVPRPARLTATL
jgi:hypothetical protein